ncbi:MAG: hypothetical protein MZV64_52710 [Ignavibacteriales bacterium]|nr:hypothetical protein [Ignavibacteriales bacterium]
MNADPTEKETTGRMSPTDNELMEDVRDGRVERLAVLFERYQTMLYNFFLRLTGNRAASEDLVQEVFVRVLKYRAGYLERKPVQRLALPDRAQRPHRSPEKAEAGALPRRTVRRGA